MAEFLNEIEFWHWLVMAVALIIIEMLAPGFFFLWLGICAALVGVVAWIVPALGWEYQVFWFAVLSVGTVFASRRWLRTRTIESDMPNLNRRGAQYVGRTFTLTDPIVNGEGKVRIDDAFWKVRCSDCAPGSRVTITGIDGMVLLAEPASA